MNRTYLILLLFLFPAMSNAEQKILSPQKEDIARLSAQRAVVERYLSAESRENYKTAAGKLGLLRAVLDAKKF